MEGADLNRRRPIMAKDAVVSGMGLAMSIITNLVHAVERAGGSAEDIHALADPEGSRETLEKIAQVIVAGTPHTFKVQMDYSQTLEEMIGGGNYDWVNPDIIEEHFPLQKQGTQEVEIHLFHFGRTMSNEAAEKEMEAKGFRPATLPELLALGRDHPDPQKQFPIVALGSVWRRPGGDSGTPILLWYGRVRYLVLRWLEGDWHGGCRFAVVRK